MKELTVEEYKKRLVDLLVKFDELCEKENLRYSLAHGTLLGAVRHKGFIPWDDDIDVMMPRDDYEKLVKLKAKINTDEYCLIDSNDKNYNYFFAKFVDKITVLKLEHPPRYKLETGLFIDVFPVDYFGDSEKEAKKIYNKTKYKRLLLISAQWKNLYWNKQYGLKRNIIRFVFFILSRFVNSKKMIKKILKHLPEEKKEYSGFINLSSAKRVYPSMLFQSYEKIEFEGKEFKTIKDYDLFLKLTFNNYMELPPEKDRFAHHYFSVFDKN